MQPRSITANDAASTTVSGTGGQVIISGTPTVGSTVPAMVANNPPVDTAVFTFSGTFTGTAEAEVSYDGGTTWFGPCAIAPVNGGNDVTSVTIPGTGSIDITGATNARARCTAYSNGTMNVSIIPGIPPDLPSPTPSIRAAVGATTVALNWPAVQGATSYDVWRGTTSGGETLLAAANAPNSYADTGRTANTPYYYYVVTNSIYGKSPAGPEVQAYTLPAAPTTLARTNSTFSIALTWIAPAGGAGALTYNVYRGLGAGLESPIPIKEGVSGLAFTDTMSSTGGVGGTTYYYVVRAVNVNGGVGAASNEVSGATTGQAAPTSLATGTPTNSTIPLTWVAAAGAVTYSLYRGLATGQEVLVTGGLTGTSTTDTGLAHGTTYFYVLRAVGAVDQSVASNEVSAATLSNYVAEDNISRYVSEDGASGYTTES